MGVLIVIQTHVSTDHPTPKPDELLTNLFNSVQRAGPIFSGRGFVRPEEEGYTMSLQLSPAAFNKNELGAKLQKALGSYIRAFFRENGWRVKSAKIRPTYLEFCVALSKAESKASQKDNANL